MDDFGIGDLLLITLFAYIGLVGGFITFAVAYEAKERWELWRLKRTLAKMPRVMRERGL